MQLGVIRHVLYLENSFCLNRNKCISIHNIGRYFIWEPLKAIFRDEATNRNPELATEDAENTEGEIKSFCHESHEFHEYSYRINADLRCRKIFIDGLELGINRKRARKNGS